MVLSLECALQQKSNLRAINKSSNVIESSSVLNLANAARACWLDTLFLYDYGARLVTSLTPLELLPALARYPGFVSRQIRASVIVRSRTCVCQSTGPP